MMMKMCKQRESKRRPRTLVYMRHDDGRFRRSHSHSPFPASNAKCSFTTDKSVSGKRLPETLLPVRQNMN
jgi:hypothetical protein